MMKKENIDISVEMFGVDFKNPVWTAAGPPVRNGEKILECDEGGAGSIVTKTISTEAAEVPTPCMAQVSGGFLNTELWSELPPEQWLEEEYKIAQDSEAPIIISLGYSAEDIGSLAPKVEPYADALELSSHYLGDDPTPVKESIQAAKEKVDVPVLAKLSPNVSDIKMFAKASEEAGADGLVTINSFGPCLAIDLETGNPFMGSDEGYGWMSGPGLRPLALRCVFDAAQAVDIPIIGVGGVSHGRDVAEMLMAGASAVQVCTAAILEGNDVFAQINRQLVDFMAAHDYASLEEMRGIAIEKQDHWDNTEKEPHVSDDCTGCGLCAQSCIYDAIAVDEKAEIDHDECFGCGLCVSRCRAIGVNAIYWD